MGQSEFYNTRLHASMGILDLFSPSGETLDDIKILPIQLQGIYKTPYKALGLDVVFLR